jgi:tetratricopeptide (TPR) repeat protein
MATHIDVLCGNYRDVVIWNQAATRADRRYEAQAGADNFYTVYRCHDWHFTIYGAMFLGQLEPALTAAAELREALPESLLRTGSWADWLEGFVPMGLHALVRFGRWDDILAEPIPEDPELYCVTTSLLRYARGIAYAATGRVDEADAERALFRAAVARVPESRYVFNNTCEDILAVGSAMLDGEVEYRRGNHDAAFAHLRRSVELDDTLVYDEPWGWMQPARHALGALLLEQERGEEACAVYRADLGLDGTLRRPCQHPENVWSLHGYHECLVRLGRTAEAEMIRPRLDLALARATVPVKASCFCRRSATAA